MTLGDAGATAPGRKRARSSSAAAQGLAIPGRTELLEEEFHRAGVVIAGFQEGRSRADATRAGR
eukprot:3644045-Lingulodinium_polyedra.AAC.1